MKKTISYITYFSATAVLCVSLALLINLTIDYKKINDYQQLRLIEQRDTIWLAKQNVIEKMLNEKK